MGLYRSIAPVQALVEVADQAGHLGAPDLDHGKQDHRQAHNQRNRHQRIELAQECGAIDGEYGEQQDTNDAGNQHGHPQQGVHQLRKKRNRGRHVDQALHHGENIKEDGHAAFDPPVCAGLVHAVKRQIILVVVSYLVRPDKVQSDGAEEGHKYEEHQKPGQRPASAQRDDIRGSVDSGCHAGPAVGTKHQGAHTKPDGKSLCKPGFLFWFHTFLPSLSPYLTVRCLLRRFYWVMI